MSNKKPQETEVPEIVNAVAPVEEIADNFLGALDGAVAPVIATDKSVPMVTYLAAYKLPMGASRTTGKPYTKVLAMAKLAGIEAVKALARDDYQSYNKLVRPVLEQVAIGITITKTIKIVKV